MKKNVKKLIALTLSATMVIALAACTPTKKDDSTTAVPGAEEVTTTAASEDLAINTTDPISLRFNWWGGDARHQATLSAIEKFQEKYPNITIHAEYEAWTGHEEKVALAINGGTAADIMQVNWGWVYDYSPKGTNFYDLNKTTGILDLTNFDKESLDILTTGGALQAVPVSNTGRVFYWNESTFEKVGVEIPTTLEELYAVGEAFAEYEGGSHYPIALGELDRMMLLVYYLESVYGVNWVEDNQLMYTEEQLAEGLEFIMKLEEKHVTPSIATITGDGADSLDKNPKWMDGKYAGIFEWDSSAAKFQGALSEGQNLVVGDFVKMGEFQGGFTKIAMGLAISGTTEYPAECAAFIEYLLAEEEAVKILGDSRGIPANTKGYAILEPELAGNIVAEANEKVMGWSQYQLDPKFESAGLKNNDGAYYMVMQMLSGGEDDAAGCANLLYTEITKELSR